MFMVMRLPVSKSIYALVGSAALCAVVLFYYCYTREGQLNNQQPQNVVVKDEGEESVRVTFDQLDQETKDYLVPRITKGVANAVNRGIDVFCAQYRINDELERSLIFSDSGAGPLLDLGNKDIPSIVFICVIKPGKRRGEERLTVCNHFICSWPKSRLTIQYKCLEGDVDRPIAFIAAAQMQGGNLNNHVDMTLYYSKEEGWKRLTEKRERP